MRRKYKLLDVEDRPVVIFEDRKGFFRKKIILRAFVWHSESSWIEVPGLVGKSMVDGISLNHNEFNKEFPQADLSTLFKLVN
jgi:hypothetical protein